MDLQYQVVRSEKRKTLTITVERDRSVVVHAPQKASDEAIHKAVTSKRQWIYDKLHHPQKYRNRRHPPGKEVVNGEAILYLGREYRIQLGPTPSGRAELLDSLMIPGEDTATRRQALRQWYITQAELQIVPRVSEHARALGVEHRAVTITDTRYRWGSCSPKSNLAFNWRLVKAPSFVLDYVIAHEVAHLIEANHTPEFWSIVRTHSSSMNKAKAWLKEHGGILQEEL